MCHPSRVPLWRTLRSIFFCVTVAFSTTSQGKGWCQAQTCWLDQFGNRLHLRFYQVLLDSADRPEGGGLRLRDHRQERPCRPFWSRSVLRYFIKILFRTKTRFSNEQINLMYTNIDESRRRLTPPQLTTIPPPNPPMLPRQAPCFATISCQSDNPPGSSKCTQAFVFFSFHICFELCLLQEVSPRGPAARGRGVLKQHWSHIFWFREWHCGPPHYFFGDIC